MAELIAATATPLLLYLLVRVDRIERAVAALEQAVKGLTAQA